MGGGLPPQSDRSDPMLWLWIQFILAAVLITYSGRRLCQYGDQLAQIHGWGRVWLGTILLASITSIPELLTNISAVTVADTPDLAVGDILGACIFNILAIAGLDLIISFRRSGSIFFLATQGHVLSAALAIIMLSLVAWNIAIRPYPGILVWGHISLVSVALLLAYLLAVRAIFRYERQSLQDFLQAEVVRTPLGSHWAIVVGYSVHALVVALVGFYLPFLGKKIAVCMGWELSFVGTLFLGFLTTLPELSVSLSAIHLKLIDVAVGNLLGSNLFNLVILALADVLYRSGPILNQVHYAHTLTALTAITMNAILISGLLMPTQRHRRFPPSWVAGALVSFFVANLIVLYFWRAS